MRGGFVVGERVFVTRNHPNKTVAGQTGVVTNIVAGKRRFIYEVDFGLRRLNIEGAWLRPWVATCVVCHKHDYDTSDWSEKADGDVCPNCAETCKAEIGVFAMDRQMFEEYQCASAHGVYMGD